MQRVWIRSKKRSAEASRGWSVRGSRGRRSPRDVQPVEARPSSPEPRCRPRGPLFIFQRGSLGPSEPPGWPTSATRSIGPARRRWRESLSPAKHSLLSSLTPERASSPDGALSLPGDPAALLCARGEQPLTPERVSFRGGGSPLAGRRSYASPTQMPRNRRNHATSRKVPQSVVSTDGRERRTPHVAGRRTVGLAMSARCGPDEVMGGRLRTLR
jgi:hypothetical protein